MAGPRQFPDSLEAQLKAMESDGEVLGYIAGRERLAADPARPLYHFSPPLHFMNDPNGLCEWQGRFHLFFQYLPGGELLTADRKQGVCWGHAVSDDLVNWRDLPIALHPDVERDCYSGQTLVEDDRVIAIYHGTRAGNGIATASDPLLINWQKHPDNPVIPGDPQGLGGGGGDEVVAENGKYRVFDPCIWKEADGYYSISGTYMDGPFGGTRSVNALGVDHLFHSKDLGNWTYLGPLVTDDQLAEPGEDMAVPNFWPISDDKHMLLLFSHKRAGRYYIGTYDQTTHRFTPETHGRMNYGPWTVGSLHAPSATVDASGRYLGIFNIKEGRDFRGWNDIMSLPRHYWLAADNTLRMAPVPELEGQRFDEEQVGAQEMPANSAQLLENVSGQAIEIEAVIEPGEAREVGFSVMRSPDGAEQTRISFFTALQGRRANPGWLQIDTSQSSLAGDVHGRPPEQGPLALAPDEALHLRIFIDRSIIEVFANDKQCLTLRVYPSRADSAGVTLFARGGAAQLRSLSAWQMRSVWPELKQFEGR